MNTFVLFSFFSLAVKSPPEKQFHCTELQLFTIGCECVVICTSSMPYYLFPFLKEGILYSTAEDPAFSLLDKRGLQNHSFSLIYLAPCFSEGAFPLQEALVQQVSRLFMKNKSVSAQDVSTALYSAWQSGQESCYNSSQNAQELFLHKWCRCRWLLVAAQPLLSFH